MSVDKLKAAIRDIPDFPTPGVVFKDITPILTDPSLFALAVDTFVERHRDNEIDTIAVIESRGFIFGSAVAYKLGAGLVPVRKKGKLPYSTLEASYELEYGSATLEVHVDALDQAKRVLILDDLLATGGTASAAAGLIQQLGGEVIELDFLIELTFLNGRSCLTDYPVFAAIAFDA